MWEVKGIVKKGDYNYAKVPDHPNATKNGYVLEHRIVMENHLQRLLTKGEVVHHINENKKDNRLDNLEVMYTKDHMKHHQSMKGRTMLLLKCPECSVLFTRERRQCRGTKGSGFTSCSRRCRGLFSQKIQYNGITEEMRLAMLQNIIREFNTLDTDKPDANTELHHQSEPRENSSRDTSSTGEERCPADEL